MKFKDFLDVVCDASVIALYPNGNMNEEDLKMHSVRFFKFSNQFKNQDVKQIINDHTELQEFTVILKGGDLNE